MEFKDYYKVLGVDRAADAKAISRAFKRLARQHHPDVSKAAGAEERFKEINEAYQVLGDPQKRARYDQMFEAYQRGGMDWQQFFPGAGPGWQQTPGGYTVTFGNVEDLEDLLGGAGGFSEFFQQFFGGSAPTARGRGRRARRSGAGMEELLRQAGTQSATSAAEATLELTLDEAFRGAQKPLSLRVGGRARHLDVTIPKGIRTGQKIRLPGALDGQDVYLTVQVQAHPVFERQGDDVLVELPLALTEALLGVEVEVPTLEGSVTMTIPKETQNGRTFRLRGLGMPRVGGGRGDQLVRIRVMLPTGLTDHERKFFEDMRKRRRENPRQAGGH